MDTEELLHVSRMIERELAAYWHEIDTNWGRNAEAYYTPEAVFEAGKLKVEGASAIQEWYSKREGRGARTAAHVVTNFQILSLEDGVAKTTSYMQIYAADGEGVLPTHPPVRICRMYDDFAWSEEKGKWLCSYRKFETLFEGGSLLNVPHPDKAGKE